MEWKCGRWLIHGKGLCLGRCFPRRVLTRFVAPIFSFTRLLKSGALLVLTTICCRPHFGHTISNANVCSLSALAGNKPERTYSYGKLVFEILGYSDLFATFDDFIGKISSRQGRVHPDPAVVGCNMGLLKAIQSPNGPLIATRSIRHLVLVSKSWEQGARGKLYAWNCDAESIWGSGETGGLLC
ncbi:hypothetical protein BU26DRAFT_315660 [Trematosphaeria pertusa]|uniref:Uncharacterized protein n=1 Tax=Trematosphaeria pertusa TaxID=390896 RepID=A0A6A6IGF8_9PLEO|nr:uncharacterized protein BU26DRAFT_315660 [Trematosphaeria pertusa]KAF2249277.1 hypothetical protein BU26DRAFT_315660 [Trematosphaeria pertusa]